MVKPMVQPGNQVDIREGAFTKRLVNKADDTLWAYRTAYKTPISMSLYAFVFGKACHLPLELEHKALWVVKKLNFELKEAGEARKLQFVELDEWRTQDYENAKIYKERAKFWHDKQLCGKNLHVRQKVLLSIRGYNSFPAN
ncbi:uncharacterized protein LOC120090633 [Benincasa hispida]|uniref:uncharacterized protein LOC120090633 n=1 Tax=Benincasa hispida TaxID=102211 RepID=UPI0019014D78|nr:uncharacterized protein LOC120090633 [Benincasa hispida]